MPLVVVLAVTIAWTALDVREDVHQFDESRAGIALIAGVVALLHLRTPAGARALGCPRVAARITDGLLPLALVAVVLALAVPSDDVAERGDLVLAILVAFTALGIAPDRLWRLRRRWRAVLALSVGPLVVFAPLAWAISLLFSSPVREGVLVLGLSCTEVAAVGLVSLGRGDAALAVGALTGSLVAAATAGPLLVDLLADQPADADAASLLGRFVLIVLVPLAGGVALRALWPRIARHEAPLAAGATLAVVVLVYAALSGTAGGDEVLAAFVAATAFLLLSALPAAGWWRLAPARDRSAGALAIVLRDFAVAATLATQAFGPQAATVAGIYGVLMLIAGAFATARLRRDSLTS